MDKRGVSIGIIIGIVIGVIVLVVIALFMFRGGDENTSVDSGNVDSEGGNAGEEVTQSYEMEKLAQYTAESMCIAFKNVGLLYKNPEDIPEGEPESIPQEYKDKFSKLNKEYGYTEDELQVLEQKYEANETYVDLVVELVQESCPHPGLKIKIGSIQRTL